MFGYRKARRIVRNATQVFTEAFPQPPPSLTNVQGTAATTYDGVDHILGLASEAVTNDVSYGYYTAFILRQLVLFNYSR